MNEAERDEIQKQIEALTGVKVGPTFLEWTLERRFIRDKSIGEIREFSLRDYPWLEHVYNLIGDLLPRSRVVIKKAAQIGATELALNYAFFTLDGRGNVFYALPPGPTQGNFAHARVDPAIGASPYIRDIASDIDNVGLKTFRDGYNLYIRSTSIPKGDPTRAPQLSEAPADVAIIDEFDRVPPAAVPLIRERLGDSRLKIEIDLSTPTYPDIGIDHEYQNSTQCEPQIYCGRCEQWYWLDWSLVRGPVEGDPHARLLCPSCRKPIDLWHMWADGRCRWKARHPEREVVGIWIPKLVREGLNLDELWDRSQARRDVDVQAFWNSDMGLPYEPKGSRLTREIIAACAAPPDVYPQFAHRARWTAMGVDVGLDLHVWIKERIDGGRERTIWAGSVLQWSDLDKLMAQYGVQRCVVDDAPELRLDVAFQKRHWGKVWLAQYVDNADAALTRWNKKRGVVKMERTKALEEASAKVILGIDQLPADWESEPQILEHLSASIKAKRVKEDGTTVYHFPKTGKPDHLHHAKAYCEAALSILPPDPGGVEERKGGDVPATSKKRYTGMRRSTSLRGKL